MPRTAVIALVTCASLLTVAALVGLLVPSDWGRDAVSHRRAPLVFLHRGGSARWPQNSLTALRGAVEIGAAGVEFDLGLTRDGVPVLVHDPWLDRDRCTHVDGRRIGERVRVADLSFAELRRDYRCGGLPDPDFPAVVPISAPVASLDEALEVLAEAPDMAVYLDVKVDAGETRGPDAFAEAIFARVRRAGLTHPLYIEGPDPRTVSALRAAAGSVPFTALLSAPAFPAGTNWTARGLAARVAGRLAPEGPVERTAAAHADGLVTHTSVLHWPTALSARQAGQEVVLFGHDSRADVLRFCRWPVTALIVADPELGRCPAEAEVARAR